MDFPVFDKWQVRRAERDDVESTKLNPSLTFDEARVINISIEALNDNYYQH